jgi:hypothetical protein
MNTELTPRSGVAEKQRRYRADVSRDAGVHSAAGAALVRSAAAAAGARVEDLLPAAEAGVATERADPSSHSKTST